MKSKIILSIAAASVFCMPSTFAMLQRALTVSNIAELESLNVVEIEEWETLSNNTMSVSPVVFVLGYYTPGDRGGGIFQWDANSAGIPDGGRYFTSIGWTTGTGRWVRTLAGEVPNVRMWGAQGNISGGVELQENVTRAHDDTTNIQNAINACPEEGVGWGGELLVPAGWYKITSTLVFPQFLKIRGENARMSHIVMPYGVNKDILHSVQADEAMNGTNGSFYDENIRIEDITFDFATQNGNFGSQQGHNLTNTGIAIIQPEEGTTIRNVSVNGAGIGIRIFGGGGGAAAAFRDNVCSDCAIAGMSIEPVPGRSSCAGQVSITGITGDHRWDESRSNACLVRFLNYAGPALVEDVNAEGIYGGGVIQSQLPGEADANDQMGILSIRNCTLNGGTSYGGFDGPHDFVALKDGGGNHTSALVVENVMSYGTNLIRDELTGRRVLGLDADGLGLNQNVCRLPIEYESWNLHETNGDGTPAVSTRLVTGGETVYNFTAPSKGWYRVLKSIQGWRLGGRLTVTSLRESSECQVDAVSVNSPNAVQISVSRATFDDGVDQIPAVTKVRAGVYLGPDGNDRDFVDIYVANPLRSTWDPDIANLITLTYPAYEVNNMAVSSGMSQLQNPTTALTSIVPPGCTLLQCVTNNLTR